jgi:hypothetical protein
MQPLVTVWCIFGCDLQPCSVVTCRERNIKPNYINIRINGNNKRSNNRTGLEDATETTPQGDQRLHVQ